MSLRRAEDVNNDYDLILMATKDSIYNVLENYVFFNKFISPKRTIIIGPNSIRQIIEEDKNGYVFIDEDFVLDGLSYSSVYKTISQIDDTAINRSGWYLQQFLKMAYAFLCKEEYYLVWDSDTIPLHEICMIDPKGKVYLDVKSEYNKPYFDTIENLGIGISRFASFSFISEHMLIEKRRMIEMIESIENNDIEKGTFWKIIIESIKPHQLKYSGFSEFETYGNYMYSFYRNDIAIRKWKSLRSASLFYKGIDEKMIEKLCKHFDAVSFEKNKHSDTPFLNPLTNITLLVIVYESSKETVKKMIRICSLFFNSCRRK